MQSQNARNQCPFCRWYIPNLAPHELWIMCQVLWLSEHYHCDIEQANAATSHQTVFLMRVWAVDGTLSNAHPYFPLSWTFLERRRVHELYMWSVASFPGPSLTTEWWTVGWEPGNMVSWNETVYMCRGLGMRLCTCVGVWEWMLCIFYKEWDCTCIGGLGMRLYICGGLGMRLYMCRGSENETVHV